MDLKHYEISITPDGGVPHVIGGGVDAPSALGALVQVVERALNHGTDAPVLVLDKDSDELRELVGLKFSASNDSRARAIKAAQDAILLGHPGLQSWEPAILTRAIIDAYEKALGEEGSSS